MTETYQPRNRLHQLTSKLMTDTGVLVLDGYRCACPRCGGMELYRDGNYRDRHGVYHRIYMCTACGKGAGDNRLIRKSPPQPVASQPDRLLAQKGIPSTARLRQRAFLTL